MIDKINKEDVEEVLRTLYYKWWRATAFNATQIKEEVKRAELAYELLDPDVTEAFFRKMCDEEAF